MSTKRILFVCTGNSCRSVMAEYLLRELLQRAGIPGVAVESAGVFAIDGMSPTRETARVLLDAGVDCAAHRARVVTLDMLQAADLVLVMEPFHQEEVCRRCPSASAKTHLLKPFGEARPTAGERMGIPDPIGKPLEVYEICFAEIRQAVERVAKSLGVHTA